MNCLALTRLMTAGRKSECQPDVVRKIQRIEDRSDECYKALAFLELPWNKAVWAALTDFIGLIERSVPPQLYGSRHHLNAATNARFVTAQLYKFARQYGREQTLHWASLAWSHRLSQTQLLRVANPDENGKALHEDLSLSWNCLGTRLSGRLLLTPSGSSKEACRPNFMGRGIT